MNQARNRIVAAVGADDVDSLLHFAADEAVRTGAELHLVHVMTMPPSLPEAYVVAYEGARELGTSIIEEATRTATKLVAGQVDVTSELVDHGSGTVNDLVALSADARLVVLQHRHLTGLRRVASGSTTNGVAARAHTTVVSVPEGWRPPELAHGRVTVGVHDAARADDVLRMAFELAHERQARLHVVHAWWLANGYDAVVVGDYHLPSIVAWNLVGERRADDARMLELLEPFRPHRYRVQHVVTTRLPGRPRHGPRMAPRRHLPA